MLWEQNSGNISYANIRHTTHTCTIEHNRYSMCVQRCIKVWKREQQKSVICVITHTECIHTIVGTSALKEDTGSPSTPSNTQYCCGCCCCCSLRVVGSVYYTRFI